MKLKELLLYIVDDICVYIELSPGYYKNLYRGKMGEEMPGILLETEIRLIGTNRKGVVDIQIENNGENI